MRWFFHEKTPASCLMQGRKIFFTRYHPDLRIFSMRLHWACIGAIRHGLNVLAHACSRAMFFRAAPPLSTIRGSLWTRPSEYSPLPGIYRLSYDFPKEMSRKKCTEEKLREDAFESKAPSRTLPKTSSGYFICSLNLFASQWENQGMYLLHKKKADQCRLISFAPLAHKPMPGRSVLSRAAFLEGVWGNHSPSPVTAAAGFFPKI